MREGCEYELRMFQNTASILYQRKESLERRIAYLKAHPTGDPRELRKAMAGRLYTENALESMAMQLRKKTGRSLKECRRSLSEVAANRPAGYEFG